MPPWQAQRGNERPWPDALGGARSRVDRGAVRSVRCWGHPTRDRDPAVGGGGLLLSCLSGMPVWLAEYASLKTPMSPFKAVTSSGRLRTCRRARAIGATVAPAHRTRSAGASSTWTPRWPADDKDRRMRQSRSVDDDRQRPAAPERTDAADDISRRAFRGGRFGEDGFSSAAGVRETPSDRARGRPGPPRAPFARRRPRPTSCTRARAVRRARQPRPAPYAGLASRSRPWRSGAAYV